MTHDANGDKSQNRAQSVIMDLSFNSGENHSSEPEQQACECLRGFVYLCEEWIQHIS